MGNICRSPTAEGVFRHQVSEAGQADNIIIDSAGTHAYHIGSSPDRRAQQAALQRGYDLSSLRGRQVGTRDFHEFDYILAMDRENLANLIQIARRRSSTSSSYSWNSAGDSANARCPTLTMGGIRDLRTF